MSLGDHLEELRKRVVFALVGIVPLVILGLVFGAPLIDILVVPLREQLVAADQPTKLLATSPLETFGAYLKVSLVLALIVGMPWVLFQLWLFIAPGLYQAEKRFVYFLLPLSAVMTAIGIAFLYYILLPVSLYFLISFGTSIAQDVVPASAALPPGIELSEIPVLGAEPEAPAVGEMWVNERLNELRIRVDESRTLGVPLRGDGLIAQEYRIGEYISLVFMLGIVFALAFQLPVVLMLLGWVGILEPKELTKYRRHIVFGCGVAGAVLTPQDPMSMILLGGALYALFEFGIVLMRFVPASRVAGGAERR